jgi:hypothetical protein
MEAQAREYFVRRLNEVAEAKMKAKAVELFGPTGRPQQPTWGQVFEGIRSGEIVLKADKVDYTGPYLNPQDVEWPAMEAKKQELCDYQGLVNAEKQRAMDAVYLDTSAQEALKAFEAI